MIKKLLITFISAFIIGFTALSPIIISTVAGNWWFLLMYSFIWIYIILEIKILIYIIECDFKSKK